jgi:hypothetical protein
MPQSNLQTVPVNNIYFQHEGKLQDRPTGADYGDCFPATRKARTAWSIHIFKFQLAPTAASIQKADGGFTPEIPRKYVCDIKSGEFFELAKLLPKHLNKLNVGSDYTGNLINTAQASSANIEEWTTAFNTYMLIVVQKFPNHASEILQYMETIRHAAKTHGGLGFCIYDHKFCYKAAACRTLSWANNIDMQLWLCIFTASSAQLQEDYSLFSNRPSNKAGAARDGICHSYSRGRPCPLRPNCPYTH